MGKGEQQELDDMVRFSGLPGGKVIMPELPVSSAIEATIVSENPALNAIHGEEYKPNSGIEEGKKGVLGKIAKIFK